MAVRSPKSAFLSDWQRERLFVRMARDGCAYDAPLLLYPCAMGARHNIRKLVGMRAIRVNSLMVTLNALYALMGE